MQVQNIEHITALDKSKDEHLTIIYKNEQKFETYIEKFARLPPEKRKNVLNHSENYKNQSADI